MVDAIWMVLGAVWATSAIVMFIVLARVDARSRRPPVDSMADHLDALMVARLLIEIDRETERYRQGAEITEGAPRERP